MLWNVVFDFFIRYIFGGYDSNGDVYLANFGTDIDGDNYYTAYLNLEKPFIFSVDEPRFLPLGNYFSLIATIITMVAIVLICCALIKKIYNMCAHIIG